MSISTYFMANIHQNGPEIFGTKDSLFIHMMSKKCVLKCIGILFLLWIWYNKYWFVSFIVTMPSCSKVTVMGVATLLYFENKLLIHSDLTKRLKLFYFLVLPAMVFFFSGVKVREGWRLVGVFLEGTPLTCLKKVALLLEKKTLLLVQNSLEENCAICNRPKND
jgi:hypothetical protein